MQEEQQEEEEGNYGIKEVPSMKQITAAQQGRESKASLDGSFEGFS